jgi:hypothetical protein
MRARPGMSVHREDAQRDAEAREAGYAEGVNAVIAMHIEERDLDAARRVRAYFAEEPAEAGSAQ